MALSIATGAPTAVADTADQRELVLFESHARPAPVAESATGQFVLDLLDGDRQSGREPLDDDDEALAV